MNPSAAAERARRSLVTGVLTFGLAACAVEAPVPPVEADQTRPRGPTAAEMARTARSLLGRAAGDVIVTLGPATIVPFESGYEVWVYRFVEPAPRNAGRKGADSGERRDAQAREAAPSELVMLLTPAGTVAKVRVRSAAR